MITEYTPIRRQDKRWTVQVKCTEIDGDTKRIEWHQDGIFATQSAAQKHAKNCAHFSYSGKAKQ